jgi:NAD(P)-dependent dehydrogenase (short-subunit alcohol dehydrogenase family)
MARRLLAEIDAPLLVLPGNHDVGEARASSRSAIGHPAEPGEIIGTALYLAGAASSYTTAAVIRVDGGHY